MHILDHPFRSAESGFHGNSRTSSKKNFSTADAQLYRPFGTPLRSGVRASLIMTTENNMITGDLPAHPAQFKKMSGHILFKAALRLL